MRRILWIIIMPIVIGFMKIEAALHKIVRALMPKKMITYGELWERHKHDSKKKLIKAICVITGVLNNNPGQIDRDFYMDLRKTSRKALLKTMMLLSLAYTKRVQGKEPA